MILNFLDVSTMQCCNLSLETLVPKIGHGLETLVPGHQSWSFDLGARASVVVF